MPFVYAPIFWLGLGCVSLPIIIHLLNRRRFTVRPWAAMQFLLESLRRNRRRLRIEELILLALRCLAILALAIAIARIFARSDLPGSTESHTSVFVLDDSYSMDQNVASEPIFRAAANDMVEQIRKLPKQSKVAVVLASSARTATPLFGLDLVENLDAEELKRRLEAVRPSDKRVPLADMLAKADRVLKGQTGAKRLWVLSDFRAGDLRSDSQANAIRAQFKSLVASDVELVALDYGRGPHDNLTIESIELLDRFAIANTEVRVAVTVRNNSPTRSPRVRLSGSVRFAAPTGPASETDPPAAAPDPVPLDEQTIASIPPAATRTFLCKMTPRETGQAVISVALGQDELAGDNQAHLALQIRPALRALVVDGRPNPSDLEDSESWAYRNALDPYRNGKWGVLAKVIRLGDLSAENLDAYDVIALLDVDQMPSVLSGEGRRRVFPLLRKIECYVRDGGGLVIHTGPSLNTAFYNGPFYAEGLGLSPFKVAEPLNAEQDKFFRLDPKSIIGEGPMKHFHGDWAFNTDLVRFRALTPAVKGTGARVAGDVMPPRVLARFTDPEGSPAVAMRQFGHGAVAMIYSAAGNRAWNTLAVYGEVYVPFVLDTVFYVARGQGGRTGKRVGEPIFHQLPRSQAASQGSLKTPDYPKAPTVALVPHNGFSPRGRRALGALAERMTALGAGDDHGNAALGDLLVAGRDTAKALARDDLAGVEDALARGRKDLIERVVLGDAPADAQGRPTYAARLQLHAELAGRVEAGVDGMFGPQLRFERADRCGVYELTAGRDQGPSVLFARNTDPAEGDLAHNGRDDIVAVIGEPGDDTPWVYRQRSATAAEADIATDTDTREYWLWAMGALLAILAIEVFLAQRFGHYDLKK